MVLKWKRTVYDLKIGIRSMSVAKILSEVNCFRLDKERFIVVHSTTPSNPETTCLSYEL